MVGTPLHNRLLAALPAGDYRRIREHLQMSTVTLGVTLQEHGAPVANVYFDGGVFSMTNQMRDGESRGSRHGRDRKQSRDPRVPRQ